MINAKTNRLKETMEIGREMDFSIIIRKNGKEMETVLSSFPIDEATSNRTIDTVNQELIKPVNQFFADPIFG